MYEYKCNVVKVVDGDTVDVDIDLGFGVWLKATIRTTIELSLRSHSLGLPFFAAWIWQIHPR